jgi:hypothetical protein
LEDLNHQARHVQEIKELPHVEILEDVLLEKRQYSLRQDRVHLLDQGRPVVFQQEFGEISVLRLMIPQDHMVIEEYLQKPGA